MATELIEVLNIAALSVTISNTAVSTSLFSFTVPGGILGTNNRLRLQMVGFADFASSTPTFIAQAQYGNSPAGQVTLQTLTAGVAGVAVSIEGYLSANNAATSQYAHLEATTGLTIANDNCILAGYDTSTENSNGALDYSVYGKWSAASASNNFTMQHATLELISFAQDPATPSLGEALGLIFSISKINDLHYTIRRYLSFFAPLEYDLEFVGIPGTYSVFSRAGFSSTAVWRDGGTHAVGIDEPRFEYNGSTLLGFAINTTTETLRYAPANNLSDTTNYTLAWLQDNAYKSTKRGDATPFNSSGVYTGPSGVHIRQLTQIKKILTTAEDNHLELTLTS